MNKINDDIKDIVCLMFCGHKGLTGKLDTGNTIVNFIFPLYILGS